MGGGASKQNSLEPPKNGAGGGATIHSRERRLSHVETNPPPQSERLVKCPHCERNFAEDRVDRHVEVCQSLQNKKRDVFDMQGQRIEGTIAADYKDQVTDVEKKDNSEWRKQHEDMISAIREAKKNAASNPNSSEPAVEMCS